MKKYLLLIILSLSYTQELDLSLDWTMADDVFYSQQLDSIIENQISNLSSIKGIIVIHNGEIVSEEYFNDSSVDDIFHIWSVTKSFTSTLIGQAIDMGYITHPSVTLDSIFFENDYTNQVTLDNLLSMTSGWPENWYYMYTNNIINVLLSTPLVTNPGDIFFYNNSACHINSYVLLETTGLNPKEFAMEYLFPYLGFGNPNWGTDYDGVNNGSYDLYLNLRKMVKLGQLYLQDGVSGDNQIISSSWINDATSFKVNTIPDFWFPWDLLPGYGYLWWLPERGYLAYGYGGQFIVVVPELDLVIGTHSTDNEGFNVYYLETLLGVIYDDIVPLFDRPSLVINEILASNSLCCTDENGEFDNYIEIYNYGADTIELGGYLITDDISDPENFYQIPTGNDSTIIEPGGFLLLWADEESGQGVLHVDIELSDIGEQIGLCMQDSTTIVDLVTYPAQANDVAYGRYLDGLDSWQNMNPTPGMSNTSELSINHDQISPEQFALHQNYPNPFNPITTLHYNLSEDANVNITIYDMMGRVVSNLVNSQQIAGYKSVQWNATNNAGQPVSAGLYLYTIEAGKFRQVKKMVLLK